MRIFASDDTVRVKRAIGTDFDIGPLEDSTDTCDYHPRCPRTPVFVVPHQQAGATLEAACCPQHLYAWAHRDNPELAERVRRYVDDLTSHWRMVPLDASDVPDVYPINDQRCVAVGLDNMQRAHYLSPTLKTALIGQITDAGWVHARDPVELGYHSIEDYMDKVAAESVGWYAHPDADDIRERAREVEPVYHDHYAPQVGGADD
jgi:hypothetical protein